MTGLPLAILSRVPASISPDVKRTTPADRRMRSLYGPARAVLGLAALFSGVALLTTILAGWSLPLAVLGSVVVAGSAVATIWRRSSAWSRYFTARIALAGTAAGMVATLAYDFSKYLLSLLDPSPYNPFEAVRVFGILLIGESAGPVAVMAVGMGFNFLNGTAFGVSYAMFFGRLGIVSVRRAIVTGIGWGLFLELFQLTLYPGWLDIKSYQEFATISATGHIVYGAALGLVTRLVLRRLFLAHRTGPGSRPSG
jgi:hypothetical protein